MAIERPGPLQWLRYAFGRGLPARCNTWVLHDTTCPTWLVRHLGRSVLTLVVPIAAVVMFLPAPIGLRLLTAFTAGASAMMFMVVHTIETTERRLVKAGYVGGTGELTRNRRSVQTQRDSSQARRERIAARAGRR